MLSSWRPDSRNEISSLRLELLHNECLDGPDVILGRAVNFMRIKGELAAIACVLGMVAFACIGCASRPVRDAGRDTKLASRSISATERVISDQHDSLVSRER